MQYQCSQKGDVKAIARQRRLSTNEIGDYRVIFNNIDQYYFNL
mgnify:CR=1 FL=1